MSGASIGHIAIILRTHDAMFGTYMGHIFIVLRFCYAMSGTDIGHVSPGEQGRTIMKQLKGTPKSLQIFETPCKTFNDGGRFLWQYAVDYSPRIRYKTLLCVDVPGGACGTDVVYQCYAIPAVPTSRMVLLQSSIRLRMVPQPRDQHCHSAWKYYRAHSSSVLPVAHGVLRQRIALRVLPVVHRVLSTDAAYGAARRAYSDTIRLWRICLQHDDVPKGIDFIVNSHKRGRTSSMKKQLKATGDTAHRLGQRRVPRTYTLADGVRDA
eukprot:3155797-Rhodomonas_salina.1